MQHQFQNCVSRQLKPTGNLAWLPADDSIMTWENPAFSSAAAVVGVMETLRSPSYVSLGTPVQQRELQMCKHPMRQ